MAAVARERIGGRGAAVVLALLGCALVAGACGGGRSGWTGPPPSRARPALSELGARPSTGTTRQEAGQEVAAAWLSDMQAYEAVGYTDDYSSPALVASFTGSLLAKVRNVFYEWHLAGFSGRGSYNLGHPRVTALGGSRATVASCILDGVTQVGRNGLPVTGAAGVVDDAEVTAVLTRVAGTWKIADQSFTVVPACAGS